ncbi:MAG: rod-binding protein [Pseudomonadota bacterium]
MQPTDPALAALRPLIVQNAKPDTSDGALRAAAKELEAAFLSEMLAAAKVGEMPGEFGGGIGEEQFVSLLRDAQAEAMVEAGGIGLAEQIFRATAKKA